MEIVLGIIITVFVSVVMFKVAKAIWSNPGHDCTFSDNKWTDIVILKERIVDGKFNIMRKEFKEISRIFDRGGYPILTYKDGEWYFVPLDVPINIIDTDTLVDTYNIKKVK